MGAKWPSYQNYYLYEMGMNKEQFGYSSSYPTRVRPSKLARAPKGKLFKVLSPELEIVYRNKCRYIWKGKLT